MNDLETVCNVDLRNVNIASIAAIFVIILIVFKSISLPVILQYVIEFAICVNMAFHITQDYRRRLLQVMLSNDSVLGATVDYADPDDKPLSERAYKWQEENGSDSYCTNDPCSLSLQVD